MRRIPRAVVVHAVDAVTHRGEDPLQAPAFALDGALSVDGALHGIDPRQEQDVRLVLEHALHRPRLQGVADDPVQIGPGDDGGGDVRGRRVLAQPATEAVAGLLGHEVVDDGDVVVAVPGAAQAFLHRRGGVHLVAVAHQQLAEVHPHGGGVVHQQDTGGGVVLQDLERRHPGRLAGLPCPGKQGVQGFGDLLVLIPLQHGGVWPVGGPGAHGAVGDLPEDHHGDGVELRRAEGRQQFVGHRVGADRPAEYHGLRRCLPAQRPEAHLEGGGLLDGVALTVQGVGGDMA